MNTKKYTILAFIILLFEVSSFASTLSSMQKSTHYTSNYFDTVHVQATNDLQSYRHNDRLNPDDIHIPKMRPSEMTCMRIAQKCRKCYKDGDETCLKKNQNEYLRIACTMYKEGCFPNKKQ